MDRLWTVGRCWPGAGQVQVQVPVPHGSGDRGLPSGDANGGLKQRTCCGGQSRPHIGRGRHGCEGLPAAQRDFGIGPEAAKPRQHIILHTATDTGWETSPTSKPKTVVQPARLEAMTVRSGWHGTLSSLHVAPPTRVLVLQQHKTSERAGRGFSLRGKAPSQAESNGARRAKDGGVGLWVSSVERPVCSVQCGVCSVQCGVSSVQCPPSSVQCPPSSVHRPVHRPPSGRTWTKRAGRERVEVAQSQSCMLS